MAPRNSLASSAFERVPSPLLRRVLAPLLFGVVLGTGTAGAASESAATEPAAGDKPAHHRIGIIGAGKVGGTLGLLWAKAGNDVLFASRHPDELKELASKAGAHATVGTPAEAATFGDVVVIAVPYTAFPAVAEANAGALKGKVVLDASNAIEKRDGAIAGEVRKVGIGTYSAKLLPGALLVRGFNAINYKNMEGDSFRAGEPVAIPLASDDAQAIAVGSDLVRQAGFVPVVVPLGKADDFGPGRPLGVGAFTAAQWKQKLGLDK